MSLRAAAPAKKRRLDDAPAPCAIVRMLCFDVCAAQSPSAGGIVLVGKLLGDGASAATAVTRCCIVRSAGRRVVRILDDGAEAASAIVASTRRLYASDGTGRDVRVEEEVWRDGAAAYQRSASGYSDASPLETALRHVLVRGPALLELRLPEGAPSCPDTTFYVNSLDDVALVEGECKGDAVALHAWNIVSVATRVADKAYRATVRRATVRANFLRASDAAGDAASWRFGAARTLSADSEAALAAQLRVHLLREEPDLIVCYDEKRLRALLSTGGGTFARDRAIRVYRSQDSESSLDVLPSDGFVWCSMRRLGELHRVGGAHEDALAAHVRTLHAVAVRLHEHVQGAATTRGSNDDLAPVAALVDAPEWWHASANAGASAAAPAVPIDGTTLEHADAWLALLEHTEALQIAHAVAVASGALWRFALACRPTLISECLLTRRHIEAGYLVPPARAKPSKRGDDSMDGDRAESTTTTTPYSGGLILEAVVGYHGQYAKGSELGSDVCIMQSDVSSLYPSMTIEHKICFDTERADILPVVMKRLVVERAAARLAGARIRAEALKLLANSLYGCTGNTWFRFSSRRVASRITECGRALIEGLSATATAWCDTANSDHVPPLARSHPASCRLLGGHTDAIMVRTTTAQHAAELGAEIDGHVSEKFSDAVAIRQDALYARLLVTSRTSYAGVRRAEDSESAAAPGAIAPVVRGCVPMRGDARVVAALIERCVALLARGNVVLFETTLARARADIEAAPLADLVCSQKLSKPPNRYGEAQRQHGHVAVALDAAQRRLARYDKGDNVPYVHVHASTPPSGAVERSTVALVSALHPVLYERDAALPSEERVWRLATDAYVERLASALRPLCAAIDATPSEVVAGAFATSDRNGVALAGAACALLDTLLGLRTARAPRAQRASAVATRQSGGSDIARNTSAVGSAAYLAKELLKPLTKRLLGEFTVEPRVAETPVDEDNEIARAIATSAGATDGLTPYGRPGVRAEWQADGDNGGDNDESEGAFSHACTQLRERARTILDAAPSSAGSAAATAITSESDLEALQWIEAVSLVDSFERHFSCGKHARAASLYADRVRSGIQERVNVTLDFMM